MVANLVYIVLFLALPSHSSATYCVCKDGVSEQALQKALDYACGAGADCSPLLQNGVCYNPNTVKDHCSYAVNSYFQRKGPTNPLNCDFSGAATQSQTAPSTATSTCVYPSSTSQAGAPTTTNSSTTPSTGTTPSTTPTTGATPTTTPTTGTTPITGTTPTTGTPSSVFGISPSGGISTDSGVDPLFKPTSYLSFSVASALWLSLFLLLWG